MRVATHLLARHLEAGTPTGLTGLLTHPFPRSTLIYLYRQTLDKLKDLPEASVYRQSVESITKHRLSLVQDSIPPGYSEWLKKVDGLTTESLQGSTSSDASPIPSGNESKPTTLNFTRNVNEILAKSDRCDIILAKRTRPSDGGGVEWQLEPFQDGNKAAALGAIPVAFMGPKPEDASNSPVKWKWQAHPLVPEEQLSNLKAIVAQSYKEPVSESKSRALLMLLYDVEKLAELRSVIPEEPQLTAEQIEGLEAKISAGLIEEVIEVAEGELKLVDVMKQAAVWDTLEEKPLPGQWTYFNRKSQ